MIGRDRKRCNNPRSTSSITTFSTITTTTSHSSYSLPPPSPPLPSPPPIRFIQSSPPSSLQSDSSPHPLFRLLPGHKNKTGMRTKSQKKKKKMFLF
ncbi:hypothetical protein MUK42_34525 [Musa troglodytarum]|uniref:Uncharacterized protein n=1 Tax=Musa troglodytarum TaxID=320322 RepID=A0A9E7HWG2_9LILI|nr:hypothetical protein MUK42_34525 [Musa troglodytarum]